MEREVWLAADRPDAVSNTPGPPRVRIELASFAIADGARSSRTTPRRRRADAVDPCDADDGLRPARGMVNALLLGAAMWVLIGYLVWLITR
jgi:hypothetical protein